MTRTLLVLAAVAAFADDPSSGTGKFAARYQSCQP